MIRYTKAYIQSLLDKYMEGSTTLEEEDTLLQYFSQGDVPAEWEDYRLLFAEIESMRPATVSPQDEDKAEKSKRQWWPWSIAAAVVAGLVMFAATQNLQELQPETEVTAQVTASDTITTQPKTEVRTDSAQILRHHQQAPSNSRRRLRKSQPTMTDYDKAYALMAQVEKERQQAEQETEKAQQEILHAQLIAAGYVAIRQEDGTIIYTNEPKEYFAYEE